MQYKQIRIALRSGAALVALGIAISSSPGSAQTSQNQAAPDGQSTSVPVSPTPPSPPGTAPADSATTGDIVVTGTRIRQPNLTSVAPVTVVSTEDVKLQGTTRVEDLLNALPQVSGGQTATQANGATGTSTVDLRGLGPTRTLVLINGRRLLPGDPIEPVPDINAIPAALIKRIDVLTGGASSTYGADAVAGVVNFIMDTSFTGVKIDGQYSFYQHDNRNNLFAGILNARTAAGFSGYGDPRGPTAGGGAVDATLTMGSGFDDNRGHVTAYLGYRQINALTQDSRDYSSCTIQANAAGAPQCGGSATAVPGNAFLYNYGVSPSGDAAAFQIGPNRTLIPGITRYNFAPANHYQRPDERYTAGLFAHYDISDAFKPYMEFNFMDDRTLSQGAPSGDFGTTLTLNCDNPLLSNQSRSIVCSRENLINGFLGTFPLAVAANPGPAPINFIDPTTGATYNKGSFQLLRRNVEGGPRIDDLEHTEYRGVLGAKGDFGHGWSYDAYYQYGRTLLAETFTNDVSTTRLKRALDVVTGPGGTPVCRSALSGDDPACVPYDIFGGAPSAASTNYIAGTGHQRGILSEQVASGSISADLGKYGVKTPWSSDGLQLNLGAEYRKETLDFKVDDAFSSGDLSGQGGAIPNTSGSYKVVEAFGEAQLPVVHEDFIYDLSLNAGYRRSHYTISSGSAFSTDTYKFGLDFAPVRDIRLRGSYNRAVRVPNVQDLFQPDRVGLDGSTDPCSGFVIAATDRGCLAQGLRVGQTVAPSPGGQYYGFDGGNPNLKPEIATTLTFGVVLQPRFIPNLVVSADFYDIKIKDTIRNYGADAILAACTNSLNATACGLIHRNPVTGSIWLTTDGYVSNLPQNVGSIRTKGVDVNLSYSHRLGSAGSLSAGLAGTYLDKFVINNGLSAAYDCAGYYGVTCSNVGANNENSPSAPNPRWRHKARLTYSAPDGLGLSLQWRYFGPVRVDYSSSNPTLSGVYFNPGSRIGAQSYFDLAGTARIGDHFELRLGVNNILDREPPIVTSGQSDGTGSACPTGVCNGNTYPSTYDALGRYIYVTASVKF